MHLLTWMFFRVVFTCFKDFSHGHYWRLKKSVKCERYLQPGTTWRNLAQPGAIAISYLLICESLHRWPDFFWSGIVGIICPRMHLMEESYGAIVGWLWGNIGEENNGRITLGSAPAGGQFHTGQHRNCSYQYCGSSCNWAISWTNQVSSKRRGAARYM